MLVYDLFDRKDYPRETRRYVLGHRFIAPEILELDHDLLAEAIEDICLALEIYDETPEASARRIKRAEDTLQAIKKHL